MLASGGRYTRTMSAFLFDHVIDEAGILMAEAVVILPPDVRGQQIIQRRDRPPPGNVRRDLQPLGVLVEHRIDDVDEGLVAGEEAVPAGEQIAFEPALAHMLAQHFHHAAVGREVFVSRARSAAIQIAVGRPRTPRRAGWRRFRPGPTTRKFAASRFSLMTSRRTWPSTRVASAVTPPGFGTSTA